MLFCIAALGSTWGAYAVWFERLVGGSDRAEMMGGSCSTATQKHSMVDVGAAEFGDRCR